VIWDNRTFNITVGALGTGTINQQNTVTLVPTLNQTATGQCVSSTNYWDIGVRGDTGPGNHGSGVTLNPLYSVLTSTSGYDSSNTAGSPAFVSQYCNGSRVPPENGGLGYQVPPGIADATVPNPIFNLTPAATVDEGNNWINMSWGPLSLVNPSTNVTLANYTATGSSVNHVPSTAPTYAPAPNVDFFGNARKTNNAVDSGAVEFGAGSGGTPAAVASVTGGPLNFGNVANNTTTLLPMTLTLHNTGTAALTGITLAFASNGTAAPRFSRAAGLLAGTCGTALAPAGTCTINVVFSPNALSAFNGALTITGSAAVSGSQVILGGTGVAVALNPVNWAPSQTRNCTTTPTGACLLDPGQLYALTNGTGATLTGIGQGTLGGTAANVANYAVVPLLSTCGAATGGQLAGQTTLAQGASCLVSVQFRPLTSQATGLKPATVSVSYTGGSQTSPLNGTAN